MKKEENVLFHTCGDACFKTGRTKLKSLLAEVSWGKKAFGNAICPQTTNKKAGTRGVLCWPSSCHPEKLGNAEYRQKKPSFNNKIELPILHHLSGKRPSMPTGPI